MKRTDDTPTPMRTPKFRKTHHNAAPTRPAAPVPAAKYLRDVSGTELNLGISPESTHPTLSPATEGGWYVVESWRKVSSPRPEEKDANEMPSSLIYKLSNIATTWTDTVNLEYLAESRVYTHHHAKHADHCASNNPARVAYPTLQDVWPSHFRHQCGEDVTKGNDTLGRAWGN